MVPFHKLFSFVDSTDILLMVVGSISAIWNGLSLPLMTELFGQLINTFGKNQADSDVVDLVSKVELGLSSFKGGISWAKHVCECSKCC
ncbi:hypothetical protein BT93_L0561 [Corymbia citriodora subsp. variegata]|uniref:ABC transmembrane type-1 domain-containing protein n=1 Tax=Corymbia citriodora subsp. variegata TaxID=360336 RepID=A0A8T0CZS3_CORYI|nr:hypothetical protein BT93_L0561 [Corymbia citriodora subsp. variegata]